MENGRGEPGGRRGKSLHAINLHHEVPSCQSTGLVASGSRIPTSGALVTSHQRLCICLRGVQSAVSCRRYHELVFCVRFS
jgi:hypothetical protein